MVKRATDKIQRGLLQDGRTRAAQSLSNSLADYLTTKQAAEMLGVKQDHIRKLLGLGKISGIKLGHDWIVFIPSIEKYRDTKSAKGRPASGVAQLQAN